MTIAPHFPSISTDDFRAAMRLAPTAVTVLACGQGEARRGVTVSAVCSLSDAPPMLLACVNRLSTALPSLRTAGGFTANFLAADQPELANIFAGRSDLKLADRFRPQDWITGLTGNPMAVGASASFDCLLEEEYESTTHTILMGRIVGTHLNPTKAPLVYAQGSFAKPAGL